MSEIQWGIPRTGPVNIVNFTLENASRVEGELAGDSSDVFDEIINHELLYNRFGKIKPIIEMSPEQYNVVRKFNINDKFDFKEKITMKIKSIVVIHVDSGIEIIRKPDIKNSRFVYNLSEQINSVRRQLNLKTIYNKK